MVYQLTIIGTAHAILVKSHQKGVTILARDTHHEAQSKTGTHISIHISTHNATVYQITYRNFRMFGTTIHRISPSTPQLQPSRCQSPTNWVATSHLPRHGWARPQGALVPSFVPPLPSQRPAGRCRAPVRPGGAAATGAAAGASASQELRPQTLGSARDEQQE